MKDTTREILLRFDEIGQYETPKNFNYKKLKESVIELNKNLNQRFGYPFKIDETQDASFYFSLNIPLDLVIKPKTHLAYSIRFSNFGNLATINFEEAYLQEVLEGIIEQLKNYNFIYMSANELDENYDGTFNNFKNITPDHRPTWFTRYFDYL